jgi:hypothetical protein
LTLKDSLCLAPVPMGTAAVIPMAVDGVAQPPKSKAAATAAIENATLSRICFFMGAIF